MTTAKIRERLHEYIDTAGDKKLKAIYTLVEGEMEYTGHLTEEQLAELDRRSFELENGMARTYTWEETVALAKQRLQERRNSK